MNKSEFEKDIESVFEQCKKILVQKGREYQCTKEDGCNVFANFERLADDIGLNRESILWVYFSKHRDSIATFIRDLEKNKLSIEEQEENLSEPINGRIIDAINYLLIINSMINSKRKLFNFSLSFLELKIILASFFLSIFPLSKIVSLKSSCISCA